MQQELGIMFEQRREQIWLFEVSIIVADLPTYVYVQALERMQKLSQRPQDRRTLGRVRIKSPSA